MPDRPGRRRHATRPGRRARRGPRVGLPPRLVTLIQGEGLLNDATALTTLTVAVTAARGEAFSAWSALGQFIVAAAGGVAVGLVADPAVPLPAPAGPPCSTPSARI
ncbi:cation:proton antiporter [Modestobacter sp. DSM 44400]|uniref:cation:proton antiporter domain-containing protein n=1 Tax=Modestobacter sp. DSM 44400 TaxID=1550230 RepID=UPI000AB7D5B7|nr:cation:proton antiporter [Modestobacter sp. DSM 44400]